MLGVEIPGVETLGPALAHPSPPGHRVALYSCSRRAGGAPEVRGSAASSGERSAAPKSLGIRAECRRGPLGPSLGSPLLVQNPSPDSPDRETATERGRTALRCLHARSRASTDR